MEIRRALRCDIKEIAKAERLVFGDAWTEADIASVISDENGICYVAVCDGEISAYIVGRTVLPEGEIYRIATLPQYRRRGIARALLDRAVKCEVERGLKSLFLEVREKNSAARSLYTAYGFSVVGNRKNYYKSPADNAVVMQYSAVRKDVNYEDIGI